MDYQDFTKKIKQDSFKMASLPADKRNFALSEIAKALAENKERIALANLEDLKRAEIDNLSAPILSRLKFDESKLEENLTGISDLINLPDPLFKKVFERQLDDGLILQRVTCPIGVIGVIFESRPDALIQISALCIKSGNCCILKGGSEAMNTNRVLFDIIKEAGIKAGLPEGFAALAESRADISELLKCHESIDLIIPRGSNSFVQYIMENSKIPVMGHADGICHVYVDKAANLKKAVPIIIDAKTQYVAACNALETLLIHKDIAPVLLPILKEQFDEKGTVIKGCDFSKNIVGMADADEEDFRTEYLDYILSIRVVDSLEDAIMHINTYGSHHTDSIITEDADAAEMFMESVDSAGVYQNCSTRFADGFRYGFGAEVGISTSKLHARGPVGLDGLISYKYKLFGDGHIVSDYSEGRKTFKFKEL